MLTLFRPRYTIIAALAFVASPLSVAPAQQSVADSIASRATQLFQALQGQWNCVGGFPNGRALAATLRFTASNDGRTLAFEHRDRPPGSYWQTATWAADARNNRLLSMAVAGSVNDHNAFPVSLAGSAWSERSVALESDSTKPPINRFTYAVLADSSLKVGWYLNRNTGWVLGDSLLCRRDR